MAFNTVMEKSLWILCICLFIIVAGSISAAPVRLAPKTAEQEILEEKQAQEEAVKTENDLKTEEGATLPEDTTPRYAINKIEISGNTLLTQDRLLKNIPDVYTATNAVTQVQTTYDFRSLKSVAETGSTEQLSALTFGVGFPQYLLRKYQKAGYAGIYVEVPASAFEPGGKISQGILPIKFTEAKVSSVTSQYYTVQNEPVDKGYLRSSALLDWSPVDEGKTINKRELDNYLNIMNLNPDRYLSATVSRGQEPNSLAVRYNVYEANPWHFFAQVDNSGTEDIEWTPKFGLINTDLLGYDDKLTVVYQGVPDKTWNDEYAVFGSYDFPIFGPRVRVNLFAGYNEFNITDSAIANFLGRGTFAGGTLRLNVHQHEDWFFDVTGSLSYEQSRMATELSGFEDFGFDTNIHMFLGGYGAEVYRTNDMTDTAFAVNYIKCLDGSDEDNFFQSRGADDNFSFYTTRVRHSQYLDANKVQRLSGSFSWIKPTDRLVPAKMTTFGGMYTVRGYDESEMVADGGILGSLQYEYDLVRSGQVKLSGSQAEDAKRKPFLRKLAPLAFFDYGMARIEESVPTENTDEELASVGGGLITELGDNFMGTIYYGYPLIATEDTSEGKGRLNVGLLFRW